MIKFVTRNQEHYRETVTRFEMTSNLEEVHRFCEAQEEIDLDLETNGLSFFQNHPLLTVIGAGDVCYVVDNTINNGWPLKETLSFKGSTEKLIIGHNLKFDFGFIFYNGGPKFLRCYDTMVSEECITKGLDLSSSLKDTVERRLGGVYMDKSVRMEFTKMSHRTAYFADRHIDYAGGDTTELRRVREAQLRVAEQTDQVYQITLNNAVVPCVALMETVGILLDQDKWIKQAEAMIADVDRMEVEMDNILLEFGVGKHYRPRQRSRTLQLNFAGPPTLVVNKCKNHINYNSPSQLLKLFGELGWETPTKPDGKETFGKDEIDQFILNNFESQQKDFLKMLKEYKLALKRASSFGIEFLKMLNPEKGGTLHTEYSTNKTVTGRFASSKPNLQQIPHDKEYRECFIARPGYKLFTADYGGAELRILASMSGDRKLAQLLEEDLHASMATVVYRVVYDDPSLVVTKATHPKERDACKRVTFSKLYGATVKKTALILDIPIELAERVEQAMRDFLPDAFHFLESRSEEVMETGYIMFNKVMKSRRWFPNTAMLYDGVPVIAPDIAMLSEYDIGSIGRQSSNAPMQGTNGDMMKVAIVNITHLIEKRGYPDRILLQVHDELVIEVKDDEGAKERCEIYAKLMTKAANMFLENGVNMVTEWSLENHWQK